MEVAVLTLQLGRNGDMNLDECYYIKLPPCKLGSIALVAETPHKSIGPEFELGWGLISLVTAC